MNITTYFIKHPVITLILNIMLVIVGLLSFNSLSLRDYPEIHFPKIDIRTYYPNASPEIIENTITSPLEDKLAGITGVEKITSESRNGESKITMHFKNNVSINNSLIHIREAIGLVHLPKEVDSPIVQRKTSSDGMPFMSISLESSSMDYAELTHYANLNLKNLFRNIPGVASTVIWGQTYTYNIILDAKKMFAFGVNADEVFDALQRSNITFPAGKFQNKIPVTLNSRMKNIKDYQNLIIKKTSTKSKIKQHPIILKQVADIELITDDTQMRSRINRNPGIIIAIYKSNDANPLDVSNLVNKQINNYKQTLSHDLKINVVTDKAEFIRNSLNNIENSIFEAIIFVLLIVFIFLRNIKATIIPLVTIPISLVCSFVFLKIFGFSVNIITLLAMVLAIGLVVDDAIVILENIQSHIDKGLSPYHAAISGSREIGFAIVAMTLTLISVYTPLIFISGLIGELFIEFAVALAGSVLISGIVALSLSPLMCAKILKPHQNHILPKIDNYLDSLIFYYKRYLGLFIKHKKKSIAILIMCFYLITLLLHILPRETAPEEDRGFIGVYIPSIPGKDIHAMEEKISLVRSKIYPINEAKSEIVFMGDWGANLILPLKPQNLRKRSAEDILNYIRPLVSKIPSIDVIPWSDNTGLPGISRNIDERSLSFAISTTDDYDKLFTVVESIRKHMKDQDTFQNFHHNLKLDTLNYQIIMDTNKMAQLNISPNQIAKTIEIFFSGSRSLSFTKDDIIYPITLKGKEPRWDLNNLYVTNSSGKRISLSVISEIVSTTSPNTLFHYNQMRSDIISTDIPKDTDLSSAAQQFLYQVNQKLPPSYKATWTGSIKSFEESERTMKFLFLLAIVFIYAILAVQFENFIDPIIILFTVPLACLGGLSFVWLFGNSLNIYTQIGLITLIGLITKHGILIVEFANQLLKKMSLEKAIVQAASLRLRPILMTTGAMIFGTIPLILANQSGHEARQAIGIVLIGGLSLGTFFTLFILPTIYLLVNISVRKINHMFSKNIGLSD
ncbi:MAG: efflux RND transporter permease subunit, partial [Legionellales bacterium]|nr:efflux RND transporter permease subunit [Legionellales bacterium]